MKMYLPILAAVGSTWWLTPDQQGERSFSDGEYAKAAEQFYDPMWQGTAWFRAGEFKKAVTAFSRSSTAEAYYNLGNCWVMLGKYEKAVESYSLALKKREGWVEAEENLSLAKARAAMVEQKGGDMGDQQIGADKVVFDKDKSAESKGQDTEVAGGKELTEGQMQALWLRQVATKPADFLRSKFSYQHAQGEGGKE